MNDTYAKAFRLAVDSFRGARENLVAVMRLCQDANLASGRQPDEIATSYLIDLDWATALSAPGPIPDPENISLRSELELAQFVCEILSDPAERTSVLHAEVLGLASIKVSVRDDADEQLVRSWRHRASQLGIEVNWHVTDEHARPE